MSDENGERSRLGTVRMILTEALENGLGHEETGKVPGYAFPVVTPDPPAFVISQALDGDFLEGTGSSTFCTDNARWTVVLLAGNPQDEASWEQLEYWAERIRPALKDCQKDERWHQKDERPRLTSFGAAENLNFGGIQLLGSFVTIEAAIHLK